MQAILAMPDAPDAVTEPYPSNAANPLALTQEQTMVRDMVARYFRDNFEDSELGRGPLTPGRWQDLAALGLFAAILPERAGGLGGSARDTALIAEEFGHMLAISPLGEGVVAAAGLVARYGDDALVERWVAPVLDGQQHLAWAPGRIEIDANGCLTGELTLVRWAAQSGAFVVPVSDGAHLVPVGGPGVQLEPGALVDGTPVATVKLDRAQGESIQVPPGAAVLAEAEAQLCYVAEMVGAMALLHRQTANYTQQRLQFGKAIGSFQVVQHKLARMLVLLEQSRSSLLRASLRDRDDPGFASAVAAAKAYVADAAQCLAEEAVQLHGGIGITDELVVGRGLRRVAVLARLFGTAEHARAQLWA